MAILAVPVILSLAIADAPAVAPETLATVAEAESGGNPLAIHDNSSGTSYRPTLIGDAIAQASRLLAEGHSLDLGLLQINALNLQRTGLTVESAFDPAQSVRAGAIIMVAAYERCIPGRSQQAALRCMASIYNTGGEQAGIFNGYVARLWRVAAQIVPAIESANLPPMPSSSAVNPQNPEPPAWDIWAHADWAASLGDPQPPLAPALSPPAPDADSIVILHRINSEVAP